MIWTRIYIFRGWIWANECKFQATVPTTRHIGVYIEWHLYFKCSECRVLTVFSLNKIFHNEICLIKLEQMVLIVMFAHHVRSNKIIFIQRIWKEWCFSLLQLILVIFIENVSFSNETTFLRFLVRMFLVGNWIPLEKSYDSQVSKGKLNFLSMMFLNILHRSPIW